MSRKIIQIEKGYLICKWLNLIRCSRSSQVFNFSIGYLGEQKAFLSDPVFDIN